MALIINTNLSSMTSQRHLSSSQGDQQVTMERLASGLRINSAKDDAAGMAISTRFDSQTRGQTVAIRNAADGISLAQTAEGSLGTMVESMQRIRELALQSANATNGDLDRVALQAEVDQLLEEIENTSQKANFNGTKLFNGTFQSATFQTGANAGDTVSMEINQMTTDVLGASETAGISSVSTQSAMSSGDLVINGVSIEASSATDDTASFASKSVSAIAKAAAVNKMSDETGVVAEVQDTQVQGASMLPTSQGAGSVTINGVTINIAVDNTLSANANRESIVSAINAEAGLTGVRAENSGLDATGIKLIAADARNITIESDIANAETGLNAGAAGAANTFTGTFTLIATNGEPIQIDGADDGGLELRAGFKKGEYKGQGAFIASVSDRGIATVSGDLVINNVTVPAADPLDDTSSFTSKQTSAIAMAAAINKVSEQTGVIATANENIVNGGSQAAGASTGGITINGVATAAYTTSATDNEQNRLATVNAINAISGQTGVMAVDTGSATTGVQLIAADGRNITVGFNTLTAAITGVAAADTFEGSFRLNSASAIELETDTGNIGSWGLQIGTFGGAETGQFLKDIDITTVDGALKAIGAIDNALQTVSIQRANLGAMQNRFDATISNLEVSRENSAASVSRIRDADYAEETSNLAKTQVLQQAGISVLSQANAQPESVLALLQ